MEDNKTFMPPPPPQELRKDFQTSARPVFPTPPNSAARPAQSTAVSSSTVQTNSPASTTTTSAGSNFQNSYETSQAVSSAEQKRVFPPFPPAGFEKIQKSGEAENGQASAMMSAQPIFAEKQAQDAFAEKVGKKETEQFNKNVLINWFGLCISVIAFVLFLVFMLRS